MDKKVVIMGGGIIGKEYTKTLQELEEEGVITLSQDIPKEPQTISPFFSSKEYDKVMSHIKGRRTIFEEYKLIKSKKSDLSKSLRDYIVSMIEEEQ